MLIAECSFEVEISCARRSKLKIFLKYAETMAPPVLPAGSRLLCEFRAGRIIKEGTTAKPDTRKGLVRVLRVRAIAL
jgi:hypothetical protein